MKQLTIDKIHHKKVICHNSYVICSSRGFTLVEALVAIAILLVAVVGPISLIGDALHKLYYARDEMIAINLAQEAIEVVRSRRDGNTLAGAPSWDDGMSPPSSFTIDTGGAGGPTMTLCSSGCDQNVYIDSATGLYRQGAGVVPTQFSRVVTIGDVSPAVPHERKVTSVVTWTTAGQAGSIAVTENIFNWQI